MNSVLIVLMILNILLMILFYIVGNKALVMHEHRGDHMILTFIICVICIAWNAFSFVYTSYSLNKCQVYSSRNYDMKVLYIVKDSLKNLESVDTTYVITRK